MNKNDDTIFIDAANVALVQSHDNNSLAPTIIEVQEFYKFTGDINATFRLAVADSQSVREGEDSLIKGLFGSWYENGKEDTDLDELYRSRLNSSLTPNE